MQENSEKNLYVQFGAGFHGPKAWENFDASPTVRIRRGLPIIGPLLTRKHDISSHIRYGDILKGLPVAAGTAKGVYSSHVLEHLSLQDLRVALKNTFALLAPGGTFRLVLPDLEEHIKTYLADQDPRRAVHFVEATKMGRDRRPKTPMGMLHDLLGHEHHLWMWDERSLTQELLEAGFQDVRRARLGDSRDAAFLAVEKPERWDGCLGLECVKPRGH